MKRVNDFSSGHQDVGIRIRLAPVFPELTFISSKFRLALHTSNRERSASLIEEGQVEPEDAGQTVRVVLEGLALKCRRVMGLLEDVTGGSIRTINMVGGGVRNRLLCQLTADATGRRVVAGPVEATATGNLLTQAMGSGLVESMHEMRDIIRRSFDLDEYEPRLSAEWDDAYGRLTDFVTEK